MVKRILGLLGWLGVVFVFSALAISQLRPEWTWFRGLAIAGLVIGIVFSTIWCFYFVGVAACVSRW